MARIGAFLRQRDACGRLYQATGQGSPPATVSHTGSSGEPAKKAALGA